MRVIDAALGLLILSTGSAFADCLQRTNITLIGRDLPLASDASDVAKATLALPYAAMFPFVKTDAAPPGFERGPGPRDILTGRAPFLAAISGFDPAAFVSCHGRAVVIVIDGLIDFDLRDYITAALRRAAGGASPQGLRYTAAIMAAYPDHDITIIGHSAGGDVASYVAGAFGLPSITFNAAPSEASRTGNDGARQLNVIVVGDPIADRTPLPGMTLYLDVESERPHQVVTLLDGLAELVGRSWPGA
ncbi:MAG: hypothetical protein KIT43_08695 [Bauldia sp.]|nr:hypothetical protein [Bauldia sp.]MCW5716797.1 hypothetical protein [Bauldia sp.]